ncbi:glycosyltransferase family 2 protein [uncultured Mailhella sp.]|uniref:glycosyltransferase family 2 protein n=1 Tax=uncultured Mailhella sp. TaxID=1981031 RepID=UPI00262F2C57|nr:glycosyltransferase family 2 protein [uncultured Mailhella sp.]
MAEYSAVHPGVPSYDVLFSHARTTKNCLVIPVINEGSRLISLLGKIQKNTEKAKLDILIVDGGSTDGSLEQTAMQTFGVSALLLKTGPGRLSAQLRCAYDYALRAGYEGILTIDGNDKDDPAAIPLMLKELDSGVDFVQASRYIAGGKAVNTPALRDFAIRYIHAPILRVASGFPWTDTTQGFRAYSRRALVDPRVSIFRNVFNSYELLAYLSYRLPRLGYLCREVPSTRTYPKGTVPTKISSVRGNLEVLTILVKAVLGVYNPKV